jgi:hypothetical protein
MDEQIPMCPRKAGQVFPRSSLVSDEAFELPAYPADKIPIEVIPDLVECRGIETPIVTMPASKNRIEDPRKIRPSLIALQLNMPAANVSVDLFYRCSTDRRKKTRVDSTLPVSGPSRTESVPQKVKADSRILSRTMAILAVNDSGLVRMNFQSTLAEAFRDASHHVFRLMPASAMQQSIIGITTKWNPRQLTSYPCIKRVVQEQIGQ